MDLFEKYLTDGKGLSSTSANYIANVGKEYITEHEAKLAKAAVLYDTIQQLMTNNVKLNTGYGSKDEDVYEFESILNTIADIKALTAWIREAIKTKELMVKNIQNMPFEKYVTDILHEDINEYRERYRIKYDNAEYDRTVNEQAEYLKAEATAAVFGKFIGIRAPTIMASVVLSRYALYITKMTAAPATNTAAYCSCAHPVRNPRINAGTGESGLSVPNHL